MNAQETYLDEVRRLLDGLNRARRTIVLDDLRGHLADAADAGRSPEEAVRALGSPEEIAARAYEEFGGAPVAVDRSWRVLQSSAVGLAVVLAVIVAFLIRGYGYTVTDGIEDAATSTTLFEALGLGAALFCLLPAFLALAPFVVPERWRIASTAVVAALLTVGSASFPFAGAEFFAPVAMLGWAAVITPWRLRIAGGFGLGWRIAAAALIAVPGVALVVATINGTVGLSILAAVGIAIMLGLAALVIHGYRSAGWAVAAFGAFILISGLFSTSLLTLGLIWVGGMLITIGLSHALGSHRGR